MKYLKKTFVISFLLICFFINTNFVSAQSGHNGYGLLTTGTNVGNDMGKVHKIDDDRIYAGVRLTMVDSEGKILPGTQSVDYWAYDITPSSQYSDVKMLSGSSYKTKHINVGGSDLSTGLVTYDKVIKSESGIGNAASIYWYNRDNVLYETMLKAIDKTEGKKKCVSTSFFKDMNFDLCPIILTGKCEDLKKYYILIEPLLFININGWDIVVTGTEYAALIDKLYIELHDDLIWNLRGGAGYGNAILGMFLSKYDPKDSIKYDLKSKGKIYSIPTDTEQKNYRKYSKDVRKGTYQKAIGYSMQIVWVGDLAKDCTEKCCTTDPNDPNFDPENPYCCIEDETGMVKENDECILWNEYWKDKQDYYDEVCPPEKTCIPGPDDDCCDDFCDPVIPGYEDYCETYCSNHPDLKCIYSLVDPDFDTAVCDNTGNTESKFEDSLYTIGSNEVLNPNIDEIAHTGNNVVNKFMSIHYINKDNDMDENGIIYGNSLTHDKKTDGDKENSVPVSYYIAEQSTYCTTYCQEILTITLPNNYPYVKAGRYFYWDIPETNNIVNASGKRICVHDIKLDEWLEDYKKAAEVCDSAGGTLASCSNRKGDLMVGGSADCVADAQALADACTGAGGAEATPEYTEYQNNMANLLSSSEMATVRENATNNYINQNYYQYPGLDVNSVWYYENNRTALSPEQVASVEQLYEDANTAGETAVENEANEQLPNPCQSLIDAVISLENAKEIYGDCRDNPDNSLVALGKELKSCFSDVYDEDGNELNHSDYTSQLDIEYGYETILSKKMYSNDDINMYNKDNNLEFLDSGCIMVTGEAFNEEGEKISEKEDPCNPDNIFVSRTDACNSGALFPYFIDSHYWSTIDSNGISHSGNSLSSLMIYGKNYVENPSCSAHNGACSWGGKTGDISKYWKTIYITREKLDDDYKLNETINACVCKDGEIMDLSPTGECDCTKVTDYEVIADISTPNWCYYEWKSTTSYVNLIDRDEDNQDKAGNFSVEFMNPTGWYPLYLDYGNIGFNGHFSSMMEDVNFEECAGGTCKYSDEGHYCVFYIDNRILNDGGKKEDAICPDGECYDYVCPDGECPPGIIPPTEPTCRIGECDDFACDNGSCISGMELIYRTIDLDNPFPGSNATSEDSRRSPGANWQIIDDVDPVIDYIENNRGVEGNKLYTSNLKPLYEFNINPAIIKKIRVFNAANRDYASIGTMIFDDGTVKGGASYVLRGDLKNIVETNGGYFSINLDDDYYKRFGLINNNGILDNNGNLATCREVSR